MYPKLRQTTVQYSSENTDGTSDQVCFCMVFKTCLDRLSLEADKNIAVETKE